MHRLPITLAALLLGAAALAQDANPTLRERLRERLEQRRAGDKAPQAGGTQTLTLKHGGLERKLLLHLPPGYDGSTPLPLVLAFHGGGGHAEYMADDSHYGWQRKADEAGFIVAFPNGYSRFPGGKLATWNAGGCCGDARDRGVDDVGFSRAAVAAIQARVRVDAGRVFATGMSNGGMMSHRLACEAPDLFRAVASVAGTDATSACTPGRPVSVLHIHARNDDHVLFDGGAGPGAFRDESKVMAFVSVPETLARWVRREQCAPEPRRVLERPGAWCEAYSGCAGGAAVQLCVTEDGGHSWPGAEATRRGKPGASTALDATDMIWEFFRQAPNAGR